MPVRFSSLCCVVQVLLQKVTPHLSEAQFAVKVFVHLFDHVLEAQVGLWSSQLLHHQLQLHQVNEAVFPSVIPTNHETQAQSSGSMETALTHIVGCDHIKNKRKHSIYIQLLYR